RQGTAVARVAHTVAEAAALADAERQLRLAADSKQELLELTQRMAESASARVRALDAAGGWQAPTDEEEAVIDVLDVRIAAARLAGSGSSVPLLLDDALDALSPEATDTVLGWLETIAAETQIVYLSDRPSVLAWASRRNGERVGVIDGSALFASLTRSRT